MRIAFWNTNANDGINPYIRDIIIDNRIDIIILAEYATDGYNLQDLVEI